MRTELEDISEVEYRQLRLERVVLVSVWTSGTQEDADNAMAELKLLAETAGSEVLEALVQRRSQPDPATYIGRGKVEEVADVVRATGADTVICDGELQPAQLRNLEDRIKVKVVDRTALILDIFASHAKSAEGKAQVELAQLQYLKQRLRGWGGNLSRQAGGRAAGERVSEAGDPVRRNSRPTGVASTTGSRSFAASSVKWTPPGRANAPSAVGTGCRAWRSSDTPTRASPRC